MTERARQLMAATDPAAKLGCPSAAGLKTLCAGDPTALTTRLIAEGAALNDPLCVGLLADATATLGWALAQAIALINPARIVVGGGVSLIGEEGFLEPVREACRVHCFKPFRGLAGIVPASLGEEVVVHGALALARQSQ